MRSSHQLRRLDWCRRWSQPGLKKRTRALGVKTLLGRWRALDRVTVSPHRIGAIVAAALVLTSPSIHRGEWLPVAGRDTRMPLWPGTMWLVEGHINPPEGHPLDATVSR